MFGLSPTVWFIVQIALAAAGACAWMFLVVPSIAKLPEKRLLLDVWGPLAIIGPALVGVAFIDHTVAGAAGRNALGGPIVVATATVGIALLRTRNANATTSTAHGPAGIFAPVTWTVTAIIVLLLCATNVLTVLVGQCVFAAAAVVLWISTPIADGRRQTGEQSRASTAESARAEGRAIRGILLVAALAIAQGAAALGGGQGGDHGSDAAVNGIFIALGYALAILISTALFAPPAEAMRLAGWSAAFSAAFGIGLLSLLHMLPSGLAALGVAGPIDPFQVTPTLQVANGFAALAPHATALLGIGLTGLTAERMGPAARNTAGALLVLAACCLLLWNVL